MLVNQPRLANQVQGVVGQCQIFFKNRAMTTPFGVALPEDQCVVGQMQQVVGMRCHYMCPTSSGIS